MQKHTRRDFLKSIAAATASTATLAMIPGCNEMLHANSDKTNTKRPNIVFIMSDDHASHAISCYGSKINKTPNLDRLASQGMRFNNCFCTNSICGPSRAVILTGKYSHINGFKSNQNIFNNKQENFAKILKRNGYQTAMIGKWHLGSDPTGFDHYKILTAEGGQGTYFDPEFKEDGKHVQNKGYVTDIITDDCINWIKNSDKDRPFCLMYQNKAPHRHWLPDEKHAHMYEDVDIPVPPTFDDDFSTRSAALHEQEMTVDKHFIDKDLKAEPPKNLSPKELKKWKYHRYIKEYLRCIASVDDNIGRFLDFLDKQGIADNTIVVYTSDQGFLLGDHGLYDKRFMYEETLRMPLIIRYPKEIKPKSVNNDIVLNLDFAQTFLDFAHLPIPSDMQGRSLRPLLKGKTPSDWRKSMYYHYYMYPGWHMVKRHYGVRTDRYKLIHFYYDIDAWELYDLKKDPHELNNVYSDPAYAEIVTELKKEIKKLQKQYNENEIEIPKPKPKGVMLEYVPEKIENSKAIDLSGHKNHGTIKGVNVVTEDSGKAFQFDGNSYIDIPNNNSIDPSLSTFSVNAWIKPQSDGVIAAHGGSAVGYLLFVKDGKPGFSIRNHSINTVATANQNCIGKWTHIMGLTRRGQVCIYVNGKLANKTELINYLGWNSNDGLQIGADKNSQVDTKRSKTNYKGLLRSIKLYRGELTDQDIEKIYKKGM